MERANKSIFLSLFLLLVVCLLLVYQFVYLNWKADKQKNGAVQVVKNYLTSGDYETAKVVLAQLIVGNPEDQKFLDMMKNLNNSLKEEQEQTKLMKSNKLSNSADLSINAVSQFTSESPLQKTEKKTQSNKTKPAVTISENKTLQESTQQPILGGLTAYNNKDYPAAISQFRKALETDNTLPAANAYLANTLFEQNPENTENVEQAVSCCQKALEYDANQDLACFTLAKIYFKRKLLKDSLSLFKEATRIKPENYEAQYFIGKIYLEQNEYTRAKEYFSHAVENKNDFVNGYYYLAKAEKSLNESTEAKNHLGKAIELDPSLIQAYIELAELFYQEKDYENAIATYEKSNKVRTDYKVFFHMAECYYNLGKTDTAINCYEASNSANPAINSVQKSYLYKSYSQLSKLFSSIGRNKEADKFQKLLPDNYSACNLNPVSGNKLAIAEENHE